MDALSTKNSYQIFTDAMSESGYIFVEKLFNGLNFVGYEWKCTSELNSVKPVASAMFSFIRRQSWLQIDLHFNIDSIPVELLGVQQRIRITMSAGNIFSEFQEDHPKSEDGVRAAANEVKKLLDRFQSDFAFVANEPVWNSQMEVMGRPLKKWLVVPGGGFFPE